MLSYAFLEDNETIYNFTISTLIIFLEIRRKGLKFVYNKNNVSHYPKVQFIVARIFSSSTKKIASVKIPPQIVDIFKVLL